MEIFSLKYSFHTLVFLLINIIHSTLTNNSACTSLSLLESLTSESNLVSSIDIVLVLSSEMSNKSDELIPEIKKFKSFSTKWSIASAFGSNEGPLLLLFPCLNETEFQIELGKIVTFLQSSQLEKAGRLWPPIFIFTNPKVFTSKEETENDTLISKFIQNIRISQLIYIMYTISFPNKTDKFILIREIYSVRGTLINQEIPLMNLMQQFIFRTRRRSNLKKSPVIAIGIDDPDYPLATEFKPNSTELIGGFEVWVYNYFRDGLNFTDVAIKGSGYVREGPNQTLTGYSTELNKEEGDIAIGSGEFLEYRVKGPDGITYIHPIFHARVIAYFKQPPASSIRNIFTQTFTTELWICSFFVWALIIVMLRLACKLVKRNTNGKVDPKDEVISNESFIWAAGAICQQGWHISPYSTPIKIVFFAGIFCGLISYVAYAAALVSILAVEVVPIRQFKDLITEKFHITSDDHIPTAKVVVKDLEDSGQIKKLGPGVRNIEITENWEKLFKTRFAIVTIPDSFYPVIQQNYTNNFICTTVATKVVSPRPLKSSCFVKKGSPLREFFNYKLLVMQERGIKFRMINEYIYGTSVQCLSSSGSVQLQLGLRDLFTAFGILILGFPGSLFIGFLEKLYSAKLMKNLQVTM